jgi:single-strand DNA-binding protein
MRGVNKAIILGNLGADPETKTTGSGLSITNITVATSEQWTDKQSGEKQERTEWHRVVFFGRLAQIAAEYLTKGSKVYIEGSITTEKYTDKQGIERYSTKIKASELQMLDGRPDGQQRTPASPRESAVDRAREASGNPPVNAGSQSDQGGFASFADDEIPF